jgi:hydroxyquinol 1,2-dioxygenase
MPESDETAITRAVLDSFAGCPSDRVRQVSEALVRHLHAFVREVEPSMDEWMYGIRFLTRTGQLCTGSRQEFILLSDTLGVSMLVDAINHRLPGGATETTVLGPFYVVGPEAPLGADISGGATGEPMLFEGTVRSTAGEPLAGAIVDTWHSDQEGHYDIQLGDETAMRGRLRTDADGRFWFWSILPHSYPVPDDGTVGEMVAAQGRHPYRPAHVHFRIAAPGSEDLVTHLFVAGDRYLESDVVFGVKESLIHEVERLPASEAPGGRSLAGPFARMRYDFVLAPARVAAEAASSSDGR